uniref:Uncharacterized protein n=1 Tax=Rhizophora mucronata TaxID=61149 RepID=A0A2P2PMZ5_RHIMU
MEGLRTITNWALRWILPKEGIPRSSRASGNRCLRLTALSRMLPGTCSEA